MASPAFLTQSNKHAGGQGREALQPAWIQLVALPFTLAKLPKNPVPSVLIIVSEGERHAWCPQWPEGALYLLGLE